ncbi:multidrug efflux pump subunit AcrB [Rhodothalassium salexigens DSM 2132]|uniref:Multidrug efflux pump subunit AcrB n=1 Tax=Rhodothalassium salexigens DSM 2132 TaxID=1188247 RepID=A0A4R2PLT8_RHOSA|nr:efflux RND transporter permease subunit [Rhodothalassium salexigens]MBB4210905.1 multidrug efflux pump subunit AcrB [Rhodothalassium salexigens DSM 2132]MBK1639013.1 RND transporter [Rhodothalassium salexigens DSM 2132]TCP36437.1 multidrug efflux pump subunit AcrB [Rhodothalassium salexigens DSM 2132]
MTKKEHRGIVAWWARNPVAANLMMFGIILAGALAFTNMDREVWPTFETTNVEVTVTWPGAGPTEVEDQILIRVEQAMNGLDNVDRIQSTAYEGFGRVIVKGRPGIDMPGFINDVKARVDAISTLPSDVEPPRVRQQVWRSPIIRVAVHGNASERVLKDAAEEMERRIAQLPGAALTDLFGVRDEEVSIELSEEALRRYGLTFNQVAQAIRASSLNLSSGTVRTQHGTVGLTVRNRADSEAEFEDIVLRQTADGGTIRVGDVATVIDGFESEEALVRFNGQNVVLIDVQGADRVNVVELSEVVTTWLDENAQRYLPPGVQVTMWQDNSDIFKDRMELISSSALMGLGLVFLVLILTLRPKVALWVTLGIATAFAGAFILLPGNDVSLNMLSLFAFLLVIGIVVDDAIIVGESIHRMSESGYKGQDAAVIGTQMVLKPVIFAVLTSMIAFLPWMFLSGEDTQITRQISLIVVFSLVFSLIEALLILPAHLANLKEETRPKGWLGPLLAFQTKLAHAMNRTATHLYRPLVERALKARYVTVAAFMGFFILSVGVLSTGWLKSSFMPEVESEFIQMSVTLPEGTPYSRALEVLDQLQAAERQLQAEFRAESAENEDVELVQNWFTLARPTQVEAFVQLAPPEVRGMPSKQVAERLKDLIGDIPDAEEVDTSFTLNQGDDGLQFSINHPDLDTLRVAAADLRAKLMTYDAVFDARDNLQSSTDELQIELKPNAQRFGLTLSDVSRQIRQAYFGEEVQRLPREGDDVRVYVRYPEADRESLDSLEDFRVRTDDGRQIPLFSVADVAFAPGIQRINRREGFRSVVVTADLPAEKRQEIMKDLDETFFPDWEKRYPEAKRGAIGAAEGQQQFMEEIFALYTLALFLMYALIAVAFRSYMLPLLILTAIPFGFMGAVYGHLIFGLSMGLFSYFGIGAAAGVVINDNLVLVDYVNRLRDKGLGAFDALVEAGVSRFRPIVVTSVTTFIGLIPIMAERSTQAQFLKPTVVALSFGVLLATAVTLVLVPALYGVGVDINRAAARIFKGKRRGAFGSHAHEHHPSGDTGGEGVPAE